MSHAGGEGARAALRSRASASLLIWSVALAAMLPELIFGLSLTDSVRYNIVWGDQFIELFRSGDLYPRWLPHSWEGFGSPTFYFYPPLFFWTAALLDRVSLGTLSTETLLSLCSFFFLAVSGLAMRRWLAGFAGRRAALAGALGYMLTPYHLFDIYSRGALSEASAYAMLPLVLLSLRSFFAGRNNALFWLGLSYAGLILSHLPTALLSSIFILPPYALFEARRSGRGLLHNLLPTAAAGLLGIGIATLYLMPALSLTTFISTSALFGHYYDPANWFFWRPSAWPKTGPMIMIVPVTLAALLLSWAGAWAARHGNRRSETWLWCGIGTVCFVMISGILPQLWRLPFLSQVQFPWRLLLITDFVAITALVMGRPPLRSPLLFAGALPAAVAVSTSFDMVRHTASKSAREATDTISGFRADYRDAPEYLPPGYFIAVKAGASDPADVPLPATRDASTSPPGAQIAMTTQPGGGLDLIVESPAAVRIAVPRFFFPHWVVLDGGGQTSVGSSGARLLSWQAPAGRSVFRVRAGLAPNEAWSRFVSFASVLVLICLSSVFARMRRSDGKRHIPPSSIEERL